MRAHFIEEIRKILAQNGSMPLRIARREYRPGGWGGVVKALKLQQTAGMARKREEDMDGFVG